MDEDRVLSFRSLSLSEAIPSFYHSMQGLFFPARVCRCSEMKTLFFFSSSTNQQLGRVTFYTVTRHNQNLEKRPGESHPFSW